MGKEWTSRDGTPHPKPTTPNIRTREMPLELPVSLFL